MRKIIAVTIMVIALAGCDPTNPFPWVRGEHGSTQPPDQHKLICMHYWPDGHTGCNEQPGTG